MPEKQQITPYIFTVSEFLSGTECVDLIQTSEALGYADAPISAGSGRQVVAKNIRNNDRVMLDDLGLAEEMWRKAQSFCPQYYKGYRAVGLNERFRFYRYGRGHVFRWHTDGAFRRDNGERSRLTFMVYLNDGFEGGETFFEDHTIKPKLGMALFFAHGLLHEGGEVFAGQKYVLRSDVMYSADVCDD